MTSTWFDPTGWTRVTGTQATVHRQPVVNPDRSVLGYAVSILVRTQAAPTDRGDEFDALIQAEYAKLDLTALAGGNVVFIRATDGMLTGRCPPPGAQGGFVLEVPGRFADLPDAVEHLKALRAAGVGLALADYVASANQVALLHLVDCVKVNLRDGEEPVAIAIAHAHANGLAVIAEHVDSEADVGFCTAHGVEMLQGPLFQRDTTPTGREFTAGEAQCLELMALLNADEVDLDRVILVVGSDPELAMSALRLVNSSAIGIRSRVDTVRRAVMLLGPRPLSALTVAALVNSGTHSTAGLWFMLTRAIACRIVADDEAAYTVGLLSAVASQLRVAPSDLIARTGVSDDVRDALLALSGPYGPALAAVLAHEENDIAGVEATGLAPLTVANAYLTAITDALATARLLSQPTD